MSDTACIDCCECMNAGSGEPRSQSLLRWSIDYLLSDGGCDGCDKKKCRRFEETAYCPYDGQMLGWAKQAMYLFTDAEPMQREAVDA